MGVPDGSGRKLHLAVDAVTGEIAAHGLTGGRADDAAQVPDLLWQAEGRIASVTADGAYDGKPVYQVAAAARQHDPQSDVIHPAARLRGARHERRREVDPA